MEPDEARRRLNEGGVMLCMDVPQGTELHCDMAGMVAGPKFRGIKMLPPGLHLFCWDAGHDKHATFLLFPRAHVETWWWDAGKEDLEVVADPQERDRLVYAVRSNSFDRELGQYPEEANRGWPRISYLITPPTLQRMGLSCGVKTSASASQTLLDGERVVDDAPVAPVFTQLSSARRCPGMSAHEVSHYNMDGTQRLADTLSSGRVEWKELLAQVQTAFILFLVVASLESLEFWKQAVGLMCTCSDGFFGDTGEHSSVTHLEMMCEFVRLLRRQLEHVPADFFRDELAKANFLGPSIACLLQIGEGAVTHLKTLSVSASTERQALQLAENVGLLARRLRRLKALVAEHFELDVNEMESELMAHHEDAPQIVTLEAYTTCLDRERERTPASQRETEFAALGEASHSSAGSAAREGGAGMRTPSLRKQALTCHGCRGCSMLLLFLRHTHCMNLLVYAALRF